MKVGLVLVLVLFTFNVTHSQSRHGQSGASVHSALTVSATVEPSVWLVMEPDGKQEVVVANAPDSKASFHHAAVPLARSRNSVVQFSFPMVPKQFEVTKKTVMMDVAEGGKTERGPVTVTTIVAQ